ncbi:hypothetical protein QJS04_geneDACA001728 [Acorus gramineus]|uniref:Uncharacterized protein n=1 Tax=Acorus gramineus TaxID=55184 RepID=A0AAV9BGM6_ACOGR|nr:hypothetical protein QJS04_geneDACA001728 [Acorus gramineus]
MGNCQAAEAATVVIQHTCGKVDRIYRSVGASTVMAAHPGHYVAAVNVSRSASSGELVKSLKLLRPDDTLLIGHVYRLISFEEVLKEFSAKKHVKLSRLMASKEKKERRAALPEDSANEVEREEEEIEMERRRARRQGQWRPALHSISELGI